MYIKKTSKQIRSQGKGPMQFKVAATAVLICCLFLPNGADLGHCLHCIGCPLPEIKNDFRV